MEFQWNHHSRSDREHSYKAKFLHMGLFNKLFSGEEASKEDDGLHWIELSKMEQLDEITERSKAKTQMIFKHSTRCGISKMVLGRFKKAYQLAEDQADLYYLNLLNHRDISLEIAKRFKVTHESPQLLVIKNGVVVAHESHGAINNLLLENYI